MNNPNTNPFTIPPAVPGIALQPGATPPASNQNAMQPDPAMQEQMSSLYPEIYHDINPLIIQAADQISSSGTMPSPEMIDAVVDNIIKNSGMWFEDDDDDDGFDRNIEVVPVQFGFGRSPYRRRRRRYHNRNTLRDIVRILLLQQLFGGQRGYPYPWYY